MPNTPFDYAVFRVVPHVEREEFLNVGVILFCSTRRFLRALVKLDVPRLSAWAPDLDLEQVRAQLELIPRICEGGRAAGPLGELTLWQRFYWLVAPRSTTIQVSPVHGGICDDPQAALDDLFVRLVD